MNSNYNNQEIIFGVRRLLKEPQYSSNCENNGNQNQSDKFLHF